MYVNTEEYCDHRWKYLFGYHKGKKKREKKKERVFRKAEEKRKEREETLYKVIAERTKIYIKIHSLRNKQPKSKLRNEMRH